MNEQYPILFLNSAAEAIDYKTNGFGPKLNLPDRDRAAHGNRLIDTFERIWQQAEEIRNNRLAVSLPTKQGSYLEFKGSPGFDLVTKSLEDSKAGIKLLNIREVQSDDGIQTVATVYVPHGKESHFITKIRRFRDEDRKNGVAKNLPFATSIDDIRLAILESFWTDPSALLPNEQEPSHCEIWLRTTAGNEQAVIAEIQEIADALSIEFFPNRLLIFPERVVCLVRANRAQLLELIEANSHIAEIRLAREAAGFWVNEPNISQIEWTNELLARTIVEDTNIGICILDTGVNNGHPLLAPVLSDNDCNAFDPRWGDSDDSGHGTLMSGVSAYGDLERALQSQDNIRLTHKLSSVKILPPDEFGVNPPDLYGAITLQGMSIAEIRAPERTHIFCCAVTSSGIDHRGKPTSWSAAIDSITSGQVDGERRLFIASAGNVPSVDEWNDYPASNLLCSIEDPAQSWNTLTVGAYTDKVTIVDPAFAGHTALAPANGLSPYSTCSSLWDNKWPIKPEIVVEGGNLRRAPDGSLYENFPDLSILSTSSDIINNQFDTICATSAACAKAAWMAAKIQTQYPKCWPETVKGLMVHSAEWPDSIIAQFGFDVSQKRGALDLMRVCGFGAPDLEKALYCDNNVLTLVSEETIQPFKFNDANSPAANDMHFYEMPWPREVLLGLGATPVKLKVTLCYFIEPGPGEIGWKERYRYASHGLRFDVSNTNDTRDDFVKRINIAAREENEVAAGNSGAERWTIGANNRVLGSTHSDIFEGTAADLATCNMIAVYPVLGWWRERKHLGNVEKETRYSLIVSLITPAQDIDIYTPVEAMIRIPTPIEIPNQ